MTQYDDDVVFFKILCGMAAAAGIVMKTHAPAYAAYAVNKAAENGSGKRNHGKAYGGSSIKAIA